MAANEVKDLAKETAKATDEISSRISAIQADAGNTGQVIAQIIEQIESYQSTVAAAVGQQRSTTKEINNNFSESTRKSAAISKHITDIASRTESTKARALQVDSSAKSLSAIATQLQSLIDVYSTGKQLPTKIQ